MSHKATGGNYMKRLLLAALAACSLTALPSLSASAAMPHAPAAAIVNSDDGPILVRGHRGHGGHMRRGGRGHHYGWSRGRHRGHR